MFISKKSYGPAYLFGKGEFRLPSKYFSLDEILKQTAFKPIRFVDTRNYLFLSYSYERISWSSFLDKSSVQFYVTNKLMKSNDLWDYPGIENDLDNGIPFVPYTSFNSHGNDYLLGWRFAYVIKSCLI